MTVTKKPEKEKPEQGVQWAMQQPIFWALLLCFALFAAATTAFKFHLYPLLVEKGLSLSEVVAIVAILGPAQVAGRSLMWFFTGKISTVNLGVLVASALPIVFIAFTFLPASFWFFVPFAVTFGAATGTMTIVKGTAVPEFLTPSSYGAINGAMNMPVKVVKAFAPSIAAFLWYTTGDYSLLLNGLILLGVGVVVFFYLASRLRTDKLIVTE